MLLLTNHVGGLGLKLTGANTVIFVEHDWNPTKDIQICEILHFLLNNPVVILFQICLKFANVMS